LARSDLRCIGATTLDDFKKYFQKDGALTRRFQQILVEEPTKEQMYKIMKGIKSRFEQFHNCVISEDAIDAMITLTGRYLPDKNFPDKAIDCMDMTCAKYAWFDPGNPRCTSSNMNNVVISSHDVAEVVSEQCQIPIEVIMWDDNERISKIEENLSEAVIGQKEAIDTVCRVLKNSYSGIRNPNRPIGCFVFGGQSGTGKTHMAKQLAQVVFGKENALVRLDMSEFSESHSVSKLVGSPPGYVGFQETDNLIDKIKRKPYSIVLLDELEKASPEVIKLFLQVMSDGIMTDSVGNKVDFKNIILIMTGNFGMNEAAGTDLGFTATTNKNATEQERDRLIRFCKERYGAEYVNRVDEFVPFLPLDQEALKEIAKIETAKIAERIASRKCRLNFTANVYALLAKKSGEQFGQNASPLNRLIAKELEPCISDALLSIPSNKPYTITVDVKNDEFIYRKRQRKGKK
jgi:ATP-dependent Clp protease ATP-binding subunit ClpC